MSQFNWTVVGQNGKRYQIGLYHGNQSGHLMVYCNFKVMLIDFSVLDSKTYTFFLDDEMCELSLERCEDHFRYGLNLNKDADTPLNRKRKILDKQNTIKAGLFLGGLILAIALLVVGIKYYQNNLPTDRIESQLREAGKTTTGRFVKEDDSNVWTYFYVAKDKSYDFHLSSKKIEEVYPYPFPLENGDEYQVTYDYRNPNVHRIDWSTPGEQVIVRFKYNLVKLMQDWHPDFSYEEVKCQIYAAYEFIGMDGLLALYYQNIDPEEGQPFDRNAYLRLTRSPEYQKLFSEKCW